MSSQTKLFKSGEFSLGLCVLFAIASFLIHEISSLDIWWQVTIGKDIVKTWAVPAFDRYSAAGMGNPYHDSHWMFQILLALFHNVGQMTGVELSMILIWSLTLWVSYQTLRNWVGLFEAFVILFFLSMSSVERFLPRPETITFLMIALFYQHLAARKFLTLKDTIVLGCLQSVWANCHGLFVIGPFMVGCYWGISLFDQFLGRRPVEFRALSKLLAVVVLCTLITPFGFKGWQYAYLLFSEAQSNPVIKSVGEMGTTFSSANYSSFAFWFFILLAVATIISSFKPVLKKQIPLERVLIVLALFVGATTGRRNMVLFALTAGPLCAESLKIHFPKGLKVPKPLFGVLVFAILLTSAYPLSGWYYLKMENVARFGFGTAPSRFPHNLPAFLKKIDFKGQVFNSSRLGGFYLYHSYPHRIPLIDGRWEIYESQVFENIQAALTIPYKLESLISQYNIEGFLLQHSTYEAKGLVPTLAKSGKWKVVYYDYAASFWIRTEVLASYNISAIDLFQPGLSLPSQPNRFEDCLIMDNFLRLMNVNSLRLINLKQALAFPLWKQKAGYLLGKLASVQMQLGLERDAEKSFTQLITEEPYNLVALNELAYLAFKNQEFEKSLELMERIVTIEPQNRTYIKNVEMVKKSISGSQ